ncbi:hypothetical protein ONZ45_g18733 [Pleurotus djamor]|nr:hypothetical protein ONZ45_g18733 [Pleurotus djamor]
MDNSPKDNQVAAERALTHEASSSSISEEFVGTGGRLDDRNTTENVDKAQHINVGNIPQDPPDDTKKVAPESKDALTVPDAAKLSQSASAEKSDTSAGHADPLTDSSTKTLEGEQMTISRVLSSPKIAPTDDGPQMVTASHDVPKKTVDTIPQNKPWSFKFISNTRDQAGKSTSAVRKGTVTRVQTDPLSDVIIALVWFLPYQDTHTDTLNRVIGLTGSGKSSFINKLTGTDIERVGHELEPCTNDINILRFQCLERSLQDIVFVDTPGFDGVHKTDKDILNMIANWLRVTYEQNVKMSGILYFHRISDNRVVSPPLKDLTIFEKLCGKDALGNVILTTTMWDEEDAETGLQRQKNIEKNYWKAMIKRGSRTVRYLNDEESAWEIVDYIVGPKNDSFAVELQHELVDLDEQLPEIGACRALYGTLQSLVSRQQDTLQRLRASMKRQEESIILDALKEEYEELRKQLEATVRVMETFKIPIGICLRRFFTIKLGFFNRKKAIDAHCFRFLSRGGATTQDPQATRSDSSSKPTQTTHAPIEPPKPTASIDQPRRSDSVTQDATSLDQPKASDPTSQSTQNKDDTQITNKATKVVHSGLPPPVRPADPEVAAGNPKGLSPVPAVDNPPKDKQTAVQRAAHEASSSSISKESDVTEDELNHRKAVEQVDRAQPANMGNV